MLPLNGGRGQQNKVYQVAYRYPTFLLGLPSGGIVEVRKPHPLLTLGQNSLLPPLLSAAANAVHQNDSPKQNPLKPIYGTVQEALVDTEIRAEDLPFVDLLAVYAWVVGGATEPAVPYDERVYGTADLLPLVRGTGATFIDAVSARYSVRPSVLLGFDTADFAIDLDLAIGYRGLVKESAPSQNEVEAEDIWGNTHMIPASWQQHEEGRVIHADDIARDMARHNIRESAFSAGGAIGCNPGQDFGEFGRFQQ